MSLPWVEALVAINEYVVACERRFHRQCILVAHLAEHGQVTAKDEMLLASYLTGLTLIRVHRNSLLTEPSTSA